MNLAPQVQEANLEKREKWGRGEKGALLEQLERVGSRVKRVKRDPQDMVLGLQVRLALLAAQVYRERKVLLVRTEMPGLQAKLLKAQKATGDRRATLVRKESKV